MKDSILDQTIFEPPRPIKSIAYKDMSHYQIEAKEKHLNLHLCLNDYMDNKLLGVQVSTSRYLILYFTPNLKIHGELIDNAFSEIQNFIGKTVVDFDMLEDNKIRINFDDGYFTIKSKYSFYIKAGNMR